MTRPTDATLDWAATTAGAPVRGMDGLNDGDAPWLLRFAGDAPDAVLRVGDPTHSAALFATETTALRLLEGHGVPAPRLLGARPPGADQLALLTTVVPGSSTIPRHATTARLRNLGAAAAALTAVHPGRDHGLGPRTRPIEDVDFAAMRRDPDAPPTPSDALLAEAEALLAALPVPAAPPSLLHGDLWQGNMMWDGDTVLGLIDWDCAGVGHPGVDLGSARLDAAILFGPDTVDEVLDGWRAAAGRDPADVAYFDAVAALSSPPDLGYFMPVMHQQGRADLTQEQAVERRDAFLRAALDGLDNLRAAATG